MLVLTRAAFLSSAGVIVLSTIPSSPVLNNNNNNHLLLFRRQPYDDSSEDDSLFWRKEAARVRQAVDDILQNDKEGDQTPTTTSSSITPGALIRLAFHDATTWEAASRGAGDTSSTGGANGSIRYELDRSENRALQKPLEVVLQQIHQTVELSLADTIALAGAQAVTFAGGPAIPIRLGRSDAKDADPQDLRRVLQGATSRSVVTKTLPSPALDSDGLRLYFGRFGLSERELVALSGVHVSLLGMPPPCLKHLTRACLEEAPVLLPFVRDSVDHFGTEYFAALLKWYNRKVDVGEVAFLPTDVALVVDAGLRRHVERFAKDSAYFEHTFVQSYQKLVEPTATTKERY